MQKCPFCQSEINQGAIVCTGCGAKYGYMASGKAFTKEGIQKYGIRLPLIWAAILIIITLFAGFAGAYGLVFFTGLLALLLSPWLLGGPIYAMIVLSRTPKWVRRA